MPGNSEDDHIRMPVPAYIWLDIVPASQYVTPLAGICCPPIDETVVSRSARPCIAALRDAQKFTLPAPAALSPPSVMYDAPPWSRSFTCCGVSEGLPWSSNAMPPVTTPAAMLVPLRRM